MNKYRLVEFTPENVKLFRKKMGLTQEEFGEKIGYSQAAVSKAERDKKFLTTEYIFSMQDAFNVHISNRDFSDLKPLNPLTKLQRLWLKIRFHLGLYEVKDGVYPATFEAFVEMFRGSREK